MAINKTDCWEHVLQDFVDNYNSTYHSGINMKPKEMDDDIEIEKQYIKIKNMQYIRLKCKFNGLRKGQIVCKCIYREEIISYDEIDKCYYIANKTNSMEKEKIWWSEETFITQKFKGGKVWIKSQITDKIYKIHPNDLMII